MTLDRSRRVVGFRVLAAAVACAAVMAGPAREARAAVWTATVSANWQPGGFNGATGGTGLTNYVAQARQLTTTAVGSPQANWGPTPLASTTATLTSGTSTGDIRTSRLTYDFTTSAGNTIDWGGGLWAMVETSDSNLNIQLTNRQDFTVLSDVRIANNFAIQNGGDGGTYRFMGNISQASAGLTMTARGNVVFGGSNSFTGNTNLSAGTITLDYDNSNTTKFGDAASLILGRGGATLVFKGGSHTEIVGSTTFRNGTSRLVRSGGSSTLSAGGLTFDAGSAVDIGVGGLVTTTSGNTAGIIGGGVARATVGGTTWATVTSGTIVGLTTYAVDVFTSNTNTDVTTTQSQSGITTNTLRFNTAGSRTLTLSGSNQLQAGGILVTPNVGANTTTITGGTLASPGQIVVHQHNTAGILDVVSNINMANGLVKTGSGTVRFSNTAAANSGAGAVAVHEGVVAINTTQNVLGTGAMVFDGGEIRNTVGGEITISNTMSIGPDSESQGFNSRVAFGGVTSSTITLSGNATFAGTSPSYTQIRLDVADGVTLRTTGTLSSSNPPAVVKTGSGTWRVEGPGNLGNNSSGPSIVREGLLQLSGSGAWNLTGVNLWGGVFELNNEAASNNARVSQLNGFGGNFRLVGNPTIVTTETAAVYPGTGQTTFTVVSNGTTITLQTGRFGAVNGGSESDLTTTMLLRGSGLGLSSTAARIMGDNTTPTGGGASGSPGGYNSDANRNTTSAAVVAWAIADTTATGSGQALATFVSGSSGGNGWRPLVTSGTGMEVTATPTANVNNRYTANTTLSPTTLSVNSLMLDGAMTLSSTNGAGTALTVTSGGLMSTGGANTIDSTVRLVAGSGNYGLIFHTVSDLNIAGTLGASGTAQQLVKSSAGTLTLSGSSARATGNTFVNQGVLQVSNSNALYDMGTFTGTPQLQRVITVWGRTGSDTGVFELNNVNWTTGTSRTPGIVLQGNNATLRGSGTSSYGNGGFAYLSAYGDVFLEASGTGSVLTLNSPISRDGGLATTINVRGPGRIELGAGAGNTLRGTSRGNAEMDWYIGGSRNGNQGWLAVNASGTVGVSSNTIYVANGGTLSGTGTLGSPTFVQSGGILSPGNSPGIETFASGLTLESSGTYLWEINGWNGSAGNQSNGFDQIAVTGGPLNITATSGSPFTILITSLTGGNVAGGVQNWDPYTNKTFRIATAYSGGGVTNFSADKFLLGGTAAFASYNANSGTFSLTSTGTSLDLNYWRGYTPTTYSLAATTSAASIRVGGTASITVTATNTGSGGADNLAVTGLGVTVSPSGAVTITPTSGTAALNAAVTGSGDFVGGTAGSFTFNPGTTTANNANLGTPATLTGSSAATVSVFNMAAANSITTPVNLGNVYVGGTFGTFALTITNTAPAGSFTEGLNASFGSNSGFATNNSGSFTNLSAQTSDTSSLVVGLGGNANTGAAGVVSGSQSITLASSGINSGLSNAPLASQTLTVSGTVWNAAAVNTITAPTIANVRVGGTFAPQGLSITNTAPPGSYTEVLGATATTNGLASSSGSVSALAGGSSSTALSVGLGGSTNTGSAGVKSGTATISFTSTGGPGSATITSQNIVVSSTVFNAAAANTLPTPLNFGAVLKSSTVAQALSISNVAPSGAFSEKLDAQFAGTIGAATTNSGSISLLTAGSTNSTSMVVGLNTTTLGGVSGSVQVNFWTNGEGTSGLGSLQLAPQTLALSGTVLDRATPSFTSGSTSPFLLLDFGTVGQNAAASPLNFSLFNLGTSGFTADLALFNINTLLAPFSELSTNLTTFFTLGVGQSNPYFASFSTSNTGTFQNTYKLQFRSANGGTPFPDDPMQEITLTLKGTIVAAVPEPGTLALVGAGGVLLALRRLRRRRRAAA